MQALAIQSEFWGMGRIAGELYAVLYTASGPLTLADIAKALGVTKGNVSVAIRRLEDLGMLRRQYQPSDRRVYFVPNTDFSDIVRRFLGRRYQPTFADGSNWWMRASVTQKQRAMSSRLSASGTSRPFTTALTTRAGHPPGSAG